MQVVATHYCGYWDHMSLYENGDLAETESEQYMTYYIENKEQ